MKPLNANMHTNKLKYTLYNPNRQNLNNSIGVLKKRKIVPKIPMALKT